MLSGLALYRSLFCEPYGSKPGVKRRTMVQGCRISASRVLPAKTVAKRHWTVRS